MLVLVLLAAGVAAALAAVSAQDGAAEPRGSCSQSGKNAECNEFGEIWMDARKDIKGVPEEVEVEVTIYRTFAEQNTRWVLFSIRNNTEDGNDPVRIEMIEFSSSHGDIITTREDRESHEVNLWVDVLDLPVGDKITLKARVGAVERGAFVLEMLVMAFDRGYAPVMMSSGKEASIFSFSLLGVSKETGSAGPFANLRSVSGFEGAAVLVGTALVAVLLSRRRSS